MEQFKSISEDPGIVKLLQVWKILDRLCPKNGTSLYTAKRNHKGRIVIMKLKLAEANSSEPWTMSDLERALGDLKNNKSRDPEGLINEIFKKGVIGDDLKLSLLSMFN